MCDTQYSAINTVDLNKGYGREDIG